MAENPIPTNLNYGPELIPQSDFPTPQTEYAVPTSNLVGEDPYAKLYSSFDSDFSKIAQARDNYKAGAPTAFNAEALLFDKFESTNHGILSGVFSDFDQKGFIPWRDNDDTYNQDSNFIKEMYRSAKWAAPLFGEGFASGMRQLPDLVEGIYNGNMDQIFKTDQYLAAEWERATKMGGSTMSATSAFFTNFQISAANMVGTIAEMAAEDALLAGVTALSGGTATPGTVTAAAIKGANVFKNIYNSLKDIGKVYDVFKNAQNARRFFEIANAGRMLGNAAQAINPLRQTTDFAVNMARGTEAGTSLGKTVKGFGNFYRDIREVNFALTEAKLEGGFSFLEQKQTLTEEYQMANNGMLPQGQDARNIEDNARASGDFTTKSNLAIIYASNRIGFGNMFKGYSPLNKLMAEAGDTSIFKSIDFNKAKQIFEEASTFSLKRAYRRGLGGFANYFKGNISEGLQEGAQEMIQGASKDYYTKQYKNPGYGGANIMLADITAQIRPKIFSGEGFQTIASGFLMGSVMGGGAKVMSGVQNLAYRTVKPEQYKEFKQQREDQIKKYVTELNEIYKDPLKFFDPQLMNMPNQGAMSQHLAQAVKNRNQKMFQDIKDQSVYGHLSTLIRSGKADVFRDRLSEMKQLTPQEFEEALGFPIEKPEDFKSYIDEKIGQLDRLEKLYGEATTKLVNPINIKAYKKGTKEYERAALDFVAFENARDQAIFANYSFMRNAERMLDLLGNISKSKLLGKSNYLDLSVLTSPVLLKQEMDNLAKEATEMLKGDTASRKIAQDKLKRLRSLQFWSEAMDPKTLSIDPDGTEITEMSKFPVDYPSLENPAYENWRRQARLAFEKLVSTEASVQKDEVYRQNIEQVFDDIMDYHAMGKESENMREAMNILADPKNFLKLYDGHTSQVRELYAKRTQTITNAIRNALNITDQNSLVYKLARILVIEDPDNPGSYFKLGPNGIEPVDPNSADYNEIMDIVNDHNTATAAQAAAATPPPGPSGGTPPGTPPGSTPPAGTAPPGTSPAGPGTASKEPTMLRVFRRRIAAASSVEDLNRVAMDIQKKGLIQGLTQEQVDELQMDIMDAIERLANKEKEEAEKGQVYFDELMNLLKNAKTQEDLTQITLSMMNNARYMSQDQIDVIDLELQRKFTMLANGETLEDDPVVSKSEQEFTAAIEAAETIEALKKVQDDLVADKSIDPATKNKLMQQIKDKSSIFVEDTSTTEPYSTNTVFDLSNIDQFDPSVFDSQIDSMTGTPAPAAPAAAVNDDVQNLEDNMFDDISACNIIP